MKLRNIFYLFILTVSITSCHSKKSEAESEDVPILRPSEIIMTGKDSTIVNDLVNQYMALFSKGDLENASKLLYHVKNDSIHPYTDQEREDFKSHLSIFHVYDYKLSGIRYSSDKNNEIDVTIQIVPDGNISENKGTTSFVLNPVKINNHWYLTLMDLHAEGVRSLYGE